MKFAGSGSAVSNHLAIGTKAPEFRCLDVRTSRSVQSAALHGRRVVICFVSAGCSICRSIVRGLSNRSSSQLQNLILYCHGNGDTCRSYLRNISTDVPTLGIDDSALAERFKATSYPIAVIVDEHWNIAAYRYPLTAEEILDWANPIESEDSGLLRDAQISAS